MDKNYDHNFKVDLYLKMTLFKRRPGVANFADIFEIWITSIKTTLKD